MNNISGTAGNVRFVAVPPASGRQDAPMVIVWHMLDSPRSEVAMAAALPLNDVDAWRVYLGLPVPADPAETTEPADPVLGFFAPLVDKAVADFSLEELYRRIPAGRGPIRLVGASISAMLVLTLLAEREELEVASAALISPATTMTGLIHANEAMMGMSYPWTDESRAVAERFDFVARAGEVAKSAVPVLAVVGENDHNGFRQPAEKLWQALSGVGEPGRYSLVTIPGMGHALAEEPGEQAAPQTAHAAKVDAAVANFFHRF